MRLWHASLICDFTTPLSSVRVASTLQSAYQLVASKIQALRGRLPRDDQHVASCRDDHAVILSLIGSGQDSAAVKRLRAHIKDTEDSYLAANRRFAEGAMPFAKAG